MDPPERPRRRDQVKDFLKRPVNLIKASLDSRTPSPSRTRPASHPNVAGDTGASSITSLDVPKLPAAGADQSEIGGHQPDLTAIVSHQDPATKSVQSTLPETAPTLPAQNEAPRSTSASDKDAALQVHDTLATAVIGRLVEEEERGRQITTHVERLTQDLGAANLEERLSGDLSKKPFHPTPSEATPSLLAQNAALRSTASSDQDGARHLSAMSGRLEEEGETDMAAHVEPSAQDFETATSEGRLPQDPKAVQTMLPQTTPLLPAPSALAPEEDSTVRIPEILVSSEYSGKDGEYQVDTLAEHPTQDPLAMDPESPATTASQEVNGPQAEQQSPTVAKKIYEGVKTTLRKIVYVSDVLPPLKSTAAGLLVICDTIDAYGENKEEFNGLLKRVEVLSQIMESCPHDVSEEVKDRFGGLSRTLEEKRKVLEGKLDPNRSRAERMLLGPQDKQEVLKLTQEIKFAIEIAMFNVIVKNSAQTLNVVKGVDWLKEQINIIEGHTGAMRGIEEAVHVLKRSNIFEKLGGVDGAEFSNAKRGPGCVPGSRVSLLATLLAWAMEMDSTHLFWLSGLAGTGKTAVSKTFCSQLNSRGLLGASFFCTLKESDQRDVYLIIPTLARILAEERPKFGDALEKVLESDKDCRTPTKMELKDQYLKLILQPAEQVFAPDEPLVLGVDALDECEDKDAIRLFVSAVLSQKPGIPLKFFLTSRPETALRESFEASTLHRWMRLHDIEADIVKADVLLYLNVRLKKIPRVFNYYQANWPPPEVQTIADITGTLFIIAATMVAYIETYSGNRLKRFQDLGRSSTGAQISGIETLYAGILEEAFKGLEEEEKRMIHSCLSVLVVAKRPLSVRDYAKLLKTDSESIQEALKSLHSVIQIPSEGNEHELISIFHASFVDYLTSDKYKSQPWAIDKCTAHCLMADACFAIMESMLHLGVSGVQTSYLSNDQQPIPLQLAPELAYACTAWGDHVISGGITKPMQTRIRNFVEEKKVLYWIEALSALKNVKYAHNILWKIAQSVAFSPDGKHIVSGSWDKTIRLWNAQTGQETLEPMTGHSSHVYSVAFSPDGKYIVFGSWDKTIRLWDAQTQQPALEPMTGHRGSVTSVAFSPDGKHIVSGSSDRTIRLWDAQTGQPALKPMEGHSKTVKCIAFSPDGKHIVSGSWDNTIRLWDAQTGQLALKPMKGHSDSVQSVAFSPDGKHIVSGSWDKTIRLWNAQTGQETLEPMTGHSSYVYSVAFSPDGKYIVSGSWDKTIRLWDAQTGQPALEPMTGHSDKVTSVAFSPDGKHIVSGSWDNTIRLWNAQTGQPALEPMTGHSDKVTSVAFSPDGKHIASGSWDNSIELWDAQTGQPPLEPWRRRTRISRCRGHNKFISAPLFPQSKLWNYEAKHLPMDARTKHSNSVYSVAFSPDGKHIVSASWDKTIRLWDAQTRQLALKPMKGHSNSVTSVAFSPDGKYIVSGSWDNTIRLWDAQTGQPALEPMTGHSSSVTSVAFSPDGKHIVSGSWDKTIRLWDAQTGQPALEPMKGHNSSVTSVAFSPDGKHIVSGSWDKTIRLWNAQTGQSALEPMMGHSDNITSVAFSPDGKHIVSGSEDKTIRLYKFLFDHSLSKV
ncbi:hypothetical protein MD484_g8525, partial [Candolleomyces efflorescens]